MSGHNKWSKIAGKKGLADAKRGAVFARLSKTIVQAAREGGGDATMNFKLRVAIDAAKGANMPSDNIDRAIKRGTGEIEGGVMEVGLFEAYGPSGVGIVVETLSDNKNRVAAEVTMALKKAGATPAGAGSVLFNFERKAVVMVAASEAMTHSDEMELALIDAGADDVVRSDEGMIVTGPVTAFQRIVEAAEDVGLHPDEASLRLVAKIPMDATTGVRAKIEKIVEALEELDDVQEVYTSLL